MRLISKDFHEDWVYEKTQGFSYFSQKREWAKIFAQMVMEGSTLTITGSTVLVESFDEEGWVTLSHKASFLSKRERRDFVEVLENFLTNEITTDPIANGVRWVADWWFDDHLALLQW